MTVLNGEVYKGQVLFCPQQLGRRNAESTLYENMLKSVRRNFADVSLEDMTSGTDARRLFTTDEVVPGCLPARHGRWHSAGH